MQTVVTLSALQDGRAKGAVQAQCPCKSLSKGGGAASGPGGCGSTCCQDCFLDKADVQSLFENTEYLQVFVERGHLLFWRFRCQ